MHVQPDHLVVACQTLEQGRRWCLDTLGAAPTNATIRHPLMATHACRLGLAHEDAPEVHLELLAIDPDAEPLRPRWYGLDDPALRARLVEAPLLVGWGGRSPQIDMHRWGLMTVGLQTGPIVAMQGLCGDQAQRWQNVLRDDGALLLGGALPVLVEWKGDPPARSLPPSGVSLLSLATRSLPPRAVQVMRLRGVRQAEAGADAAVEVVLATPLGERVLRSAT